MAKLEIKCNLPGQLKGLNNFGSSCWPVDCATKGISNPQNSEGGEGGISSAGTKHYLSTAD